MGFMALRTAFTELFGIAHPIALAPMGGSAGGGRGDPEWLGRELTVVTEGTDKPWGVGFLSWSATPAVVEGALQYRPDAVILSFGDPRPPPTSPRPPPLDTAAASAPPAEPPIGARAIG